MDIYLCLLTHWGRVTHICVGNLTIIGSDNGLSPGRRQAIIWTNHYDDVIMTTIASQITSLTSVYSTVYLDADQRKHQSSASLAFVWGIHRDRWIPRTKGQLRGKCSHLMTSSCAGILLIRPLGTNFSEFLVEILIVSFKKMRLKVSSAKWRLFRLGLNVLTLFMPKHGYISLLVNSLHDESRI